MLLPNDASRQPPPPAKNPAVNFRRIDRLGTAAAVLAAAAVLLINTGAGHLASLSEEPRDSKWNLAIDPHKVLGTSACEKCHTAEVNVWKQTPHFATFLSLHRQPAAQKIAANLGITSFKNDSNCIQCHYTMKQEPQGLTAIAGVSCESCHGAAADWLDKHHDYGPGATRLTESAPHRRDRLISSIKAGMRNPVNAYLVAQSCYRCHTVPDERLVNVGGHPAGSLDFELVSWSQGTLRHHFVDGHGDANPLASPERIRILFVAGMIADLEHSLRCTAAATEKAEFGLTAAKRADRAAKRLRSLQAKVSQPVLAEVLNVYDGVELRLGNGTNLSKAADEVNRLGLKFAATADPASLAPLDPFVPPQAKWK